MPKKLEKKPTYKSLGGGFQDFLQDTPTEKFRCCSQPPCFILQVKCPGFSWKVKLAKQLIQTNRWQTGWNFFLPKLLASQNREKITWKGEKQDSRKQKSPVLLLQTPATVVASQYAVEVVVEASYNLMEVKVVAWHLKVILPQKSWTRTWHWCHWAWNPRFGLVLNRTDGVRTGPGLVVVFLFSCFFKTVGCNRNFSPLIEALQKETTQTHTTNLNNTTKTPRCSFRSSFLDASKVWGGFPNNMVFPRCQVHHHHSPRAV